MPRRIHVRADVGAATELRQVAGVPVRDLERLEPVEGCVTGPVHHAVMQRNGHIDPLAFHEPTATTFLIPPAFDNG